MKAKKEITFFTQHDKLIAYSAAAACLIALGYDAEAQVIFTEVDPDVTVDAPAGSYMLDLNNDGTNDFILSASSVYSAYITYLGGINFYAVQAVFAFPENSNSVAGITGSVSGFVYPYAISNGININSEAEFHNNSFQSLAYNFYALLGGSLYVPVLQAGNWFGGQTDKFLGLKLLDAGQTYYGWLRLDVGTDNKSFVIKNYAYNATPDSEITTSLMSSVSSVIPGYISLFNNGNNLHINISAPFNKATVQLFDITGKLILSNTIAQQQNSIYLPGVASGIYIAKLMIDNNYFDKKIYIPSNE